MTVHSLRILVVGDLLPGTGETLRRFSNAGLASRQVRNLREARDLLSAFDFHLILSAEILSDGRGYDLAETVSRRTGTLVVGVALSETCLWLPVVYRGVNVLGRRALAPEALEAEMKSLLGMRQPEAARGSVREIYNRTPFAPERAVSSAVGPGPQRAGMVRRRYRDRDKQSLPFA